MVEIELSLITATYEDDAYARLLRDFEASSGIHVKLTQMNWGNAWSELVKTGIYHTGPDVSEIGSTWLSSLVGMNALRPFSRLELESCGGESAFLPTTWRSTTIHGDTQVFALPFLVDTRLVFYRRDLLAKTGIDESSAFQTPQAFEATLTALKRAGVELPWAVPTRKSRMTLHNACAWVWGNDGRLLAEDGKSCTFYKDEALQGFAQYFRLGHFLPADLHHIDEQESDGLYWTGRSAVTISGPWGLRAPTSLPEVIANTGVAFPPGLPFIGGSNLVIWQHTYKLREAVALVRYLTSQAGQELLFKLVGLLPVSQQTLSHPPFTTDPLYQRMAQELQFGRSFRLIPLWGLVEDRLTSTLAQVWDAVLDNPEKDPQVILADHLIYLAQQLDNTLQSR